MKLKVFEKGGSARELLLADGTGQSFFQVDHIHMLQHYVFCRKEFVASFFRALHITTYHMTFSMGSHIAWLGEDFITIFASP